MDIAYSNEFKEVIDAEKAYDLFQSEIIKDKRAFECPNENCSAQITCINIDRPIQETKKSVHFRSYGIHIDDCHYGTKKIINPTTSNSVTETNKNANIHILTERPKDYYTIKETSNSNKSFDEEKKNNKRKYELNNNSQSPKKHYWIAPLVSVYIRMKDNQTTLSKVYLKKGNYKISFNNFFIEVNEQDYNDISKYPKIYFGKAFFNKTKKENLIQVKFANSFKLNDKLIKPNLLLNLEDLSSYKNYNYWKKRLKIVIESNRPYLFFIYGKPNLTPWNNDSLKNNILFKTKRIDYMDLRI